VLDRIIAFSLRNRALVAGLALLVGVVGLVAAERLPIDVLPDLNRPTVTILTEAHGLVPLDVERFVTRYVEQSVNGATGVERVRSSSGMGLSVVWVEFAWSTDIYRNRQIVQEKLQLAVSHLPPGVVPHMAPISSIMGQVLQVGVRSRSGKTKTSEIRALVDQELKLRLLAVPGVAQVVSSGGAPRQLQVTASTEKMRAHDVTLAELAEAVERANLRASGGFLNIGPRGPLVTVTGLVGGARDLEQAVVRHDPVRPVLVADVARVDFAPAAIRTGDAGIAGGDGVILTVQKQPDVDTVKLTERIDRELAEIQRALPEDLEVLPALYRQSDFIERAVGNVVEAVRDGAVLVLLVLFLFLLNVRTTFITLTAIPLSIAVTGLVFHLTGSSINTMTLGGIAVAVGALVDDAIVGVENVFRRLKQNVAAGAPRSAMSVIFRASSEVRSPILVGTVVVTAVYLPLFALGGMEGRLFRPVGVAYIVSILASLLVAVTVTPVLCAWLLPSSSAVRRQRDGLVVRGLKAGAERLIRLSLARPRAVISLFGALLVVGFAMLATRGTEFLPPFNEGSAIVNLVLPPGTSLETSADFGRRLERIAKDVPGVLQASRQTGRAEGDEHAHDVSFSLVVLSFDPSSGRSRDDVLADIRARVEREMPGVPTSVEQPIAHTLSHMLSGVNAQVAIKIFGPDLDELRGVAKRVEEAVRSVPGVTDLYGEPQVLIDQVEVAPDRIALARYGLGVNDVAETVELALEGERISDLISGPYTYPIVLRLEEKDRRTVEDIGRLLLRAPTGEALALDDVARVRVAKTSNNINHENAIRRIAVQHNVQGRSLGEVAADVDRVLDGIRRDLPAGYAIRIGGQFEAQESATQVMGWLGLVSFVVIFLVLAGHFRSTNMALQTLLGIPMAFLGAIAMIYLTEQNLSVATLVGLVALAGIAARNNLLLRDHYLHLMREEGMPFSKAMIVQAGRERIVPVLMTALTSGIALIPIVLSPGEAGRELLYPVASVIAGGLVTSTLLDVLVTPAAFHLFGRRPAEAHARRESAADEAVERLARSFETTPSSKGQDA
jgi:CzcA family heavy metal efflux pump